MGRNTQPLTFTFLRNEMPAWSRRFANPLPQTGITFIIRPYSIVKTRVHPLYFCLVVLFFPLKRLFLYQHVPVDFCYRSDHLLYTFFLVFSSVESLSVYLYWTDYTLFYVISDFLLCVFFRYLP